MISFYHRKACLVGRRAGSPQLRGKRCHLYYTTSEGLIVHVSVLGFRRVIPFGKLRNNEVSVRIDRCADGAITNSLAI